MYESTLAGGNISVIDALVLTMQALLTVVGALVAWSVNDIRDRVVRLENLVMGRDGDDDGLTVRRRRG